MAQFHAELTYSEQWLVDAMKRTALLYVSMKFYDYKE